MFGALCAGIGGVCDDARPWPKGCVFDLDPALRHSFQLSGSDIISVTDRSGWNWQMFSSGSVDLPSLAAWENGCDSIMFVGVEASVAATCFLDTGPSDLPSLVSQNVIEAPVNTTGNGPHVFLVTQSSSSIDHASMGYFGQRNIQAATFYKGDDFVRISVEDSIYGSSADADWNPTDKNVSVFKATRDTSGANNKSAQNNNGVVALNNIVPGMLHYGTSDAHCTFGCRYWIINNQRAFQWVGKLARAVFFDHFLTAQEQQFVFDRLRFMLL